MPGIIRVRWQYFTCVPPLSGALVRFRAVGARKWLFVGPAELFRADLWCFRCQAHPTSGALIDVGPEKAAGGSVFQYV